MKQVKFFLLTSCILIVSFANATGIEFIKLKPWKEILAQSKKENKLIFLDAYASWCGPCKYLQNEVFTDKEAGELYNKFFINVKMDMEVGEAIQLAEQLDVRSYPTLYFINGDGEIVHKSIGAMEVEKFIDLGADALDENKQFYTVKKNAGSGTLKPEDFHQWIHAAENMEDPDVDSIVAGYLGATKYPVMEKEILTIMMDHATLKKDQLDLISANKARCIELLNKSKKDFNAMFAKSVVAHATDQCFKNEKIDFIAYRKILDKYIPALASSETQKMKIRYYHYKSDHQKSINALAEMISTPSMKPELSELASLVLTYIKEINDLKRTDEFITKVKSFTVLPAENDLVYNKNLALFGLYMIKEDASNLKIYADKILNDTNAPESVKERVQKLLEE